MTGFIQDFLGIWLAGGPLMIPLTVAAFALFFGQTQLLLHLRGLRRASTPEGRALADWLAALQGRPPDRRALGNAFAEARAAGIAPIDRRCRYYRILVACCPLLGLLGTVGGMGATFRGLTGLAGDETAQEVAAGISQALITTQTGLLIALPGMVLLALVRGERNRLERRLEEAELELALEPTTPPPPQPWPAGIPS